MKRLLITLLLPLAACAPARDIPMPPSDNRAEGSTPALTETYWKLVELRGQPVKTARKDAYMVLKTNGDVQGNGGCNGMGGTYTHTAPNRLAFGPMIGTMMACAEGMDTEQGLHAVLEQTDSYVIGDDGKLQLLKARMAPLAKFEAVYLP
ncbi:MAG: META domain-containing protein [Alphaproteobacteria bacterium]|nr:MAG: META domain-containing protein [Alphaproteobacteria bacterium]